MSPQLRSVRHVAESYDHLVLDPHIRSTIKKLAQYPDIPILIRGETGTGKDEIARLLHFQRQKSQGVLPFVAVNCAALANDMAASLLFGHRKGSFTGADETTNGFIGDADGGILFLDEIQMLDMDCQCKLLRVLNNGKYTRLGDSHECQSNFQVIVASTKNLDEMVNNGKFLLDLRSRLTGIELYLLPLRERLGDIGALVRQFYEREKTFVEEHMLNEIIARCCEFYWQGNIRQLFKVLKVHLISASIYDQALCAKTLPIYQTMYAPSQCSLFSSEKEEGDEAMLASLVAPFNDDSSLKESLETYEKAILFYAMRRHRRISDLLKGLKISRSSFDNKRLKFAL